MGRLGLKKSPITVEQFVTTTGLFFSGFASFSVPTEPGSHWLWVQL